MVGVTDSGKFKIFPPYLKIISGGFLGKVFTAIAQFFRTFVRSLSRRCNGFREPVALTFNELL